MLKKNKGFMLTELVVTLSIIGIVISVVVFVQRWGMMSYKLAEDRAVLQKEVRVVADHLTKDIRFASYILPLERMESDPDENYCYLYLEDGNIINLVGNEAICITREPVITVFKVSGTYVGQSYLLKFIIESEKNGEIYSLNSTVIAERIAEKPPWGAGWIALKYQFDTEEDSNEAE